LCPHLQKPLFLHSRPMPIGLLFFFELPGQFLTNFIARKHIRFSFQFRGDPSSVSFFVTSIFPFQLDRPGKEIFATTSTVFGTFYVFSNRNLCEFFSRNSSPSGPLWPFGYSPNSPQKPPQMSSCDLGTSVPFPS